MKFLYYLVYQFDSMMVKEIIGAQAVRARACQGMPGHARADVVATKLGFILSSTFFLFFFPSIYFSPRRGLPMILNFACLSI